jgi:predicted regulator of Ras-like GTPase activity (Roadblock/LC7/MglB family)
MPTIRDLVTMLRQREGVDGAIILGRDGLIIDGQTTAALNADAVAALAPAVAAAADELGTQSAYGPAATTVLEYEQGLAIIASLSAEAILLVLARPSVNVGKLLAELRRNRGHIAALVYT